MDNQKTKILILVEGAKTDVRLMERLLELYGISSSHRIVSYNTNIYVLYNRMFRDGHPEDIDLLQLLKEQETDPERKEIFNERYSDILLIFDLDPQDPQFSMDKIMKMAQYFVESSDMGMLYLNYPMVEAFYHMKSIPDEDYNAYTVTMEELRQKRYKARVQLENRNHDYTKFAVDKGECNVIIRQNINKAWLISKAEQPASGITPRHPDLATVLAEQLQGLHDQNAFYVLCTCVFYIPDYNPKLILDYEKEEGQGSSK